MAKLRANHPARIAREVQKAQDDFWLELDHRCLDKGLDPGPAALSQAANNQVQPQTIRQYRQGKRAMQLDTLRMWVETLSPDIQVILKFLGYSDGEIKSFAQELTAPKEKKDMEKAVKDFAKEFARELGTMIKKEAAQ